MINIDNSIDQKKLNEYNLSSLLEKQLTSPAKGKEKSIEEEIKFLTQLSLLVQEKNEKYKNLIEEKIKKNSGYQTIDEEFDYEIENKKIDNKNNKNDSNMKKNNKLEKIDIILKNSAYHIYKMQLTQFAESIKRINKNPKTNQYLITFDNTDEDIPSIILEEKDYKNLISIRDKYSNNDILSVFISKENCINPSSLEGLKQYKRLTPIKINKPNKLEHVENKKAKCKDDFFIRDLADNNLQYSHKGNLYKLPKYNICHQCKLQKMDDDLIKCQCLSHIPTSEGIPLTGANHTKKNNQKNKNKNPNLDNPINYFFIGQSAIILSNKIYYLRNYDDSVKELVDTYFLNKLKEYDKRCEKYYCKNCLRTTYDFDTNEIKKKNFKCPACSSRCNCSRCIRNENLIKQIAYYLNNYGDINKLYDYLIKQNSIFEKLKDNLLLSKFICIDCNAKNSVPIKINYGGKINNSNKSDINEEEKNNEINFDELLNYKKNLEKTQMEFCDVFDETNLKKQVYECQMIKLKEKKEKAEKNEKTVDKKEKTAEKNGKISEKKEKKEKSGEKKIKKFIGRKIRRHGKKKK